MFHRPLVVAALALIFATGCTPKITKRFLPDASPTPLLVPRATPAPPTTQVKAAPVGVMIAYPVAGKGAQDFASGIGFYLSGAVAGAPEFGQSPLRTATYEIVGESANPTLSLSHAAARSLARRCGATHYGAGTFSENKTGATLTYRVRAVASDAVAASESITAPTRAALIARLPALAQSLRAALGAPDSAITVAPLSGVTPDVLEKAGGFASAKRFTSAQEAFVRDTGKRVPLIAELALHLFSNNNPAQAAPYLRLLLQTSQNNTQTWGMIAKRVPGEMNADTVAALYALADRYPDSHPLAQAATSAAWARRDWNEEAQYAARAAQNAPGNPDAHLIAASSLFLQTERIRRAREIRGGDAETRAKLLPMYRDATKPLMDGFLAHLRAATVCDPLHAKAYARLATAAMLADNLPEADTAITQAIRLKAKPLAKQYKMAIALYGTEFLNNPAKLRAVAEKAANERYPGSDALIVYNSLKKAGLTDLQTRMGDRLVREATQALAANPKDLQARHLRGSLLSFRGKPKEAIRDFAANARNYPASNGVHYVLGLTYVQEGDLKAAEAALRAEIRKQPRDAAILLALAEVLRKRGKLPQAITFYENASRLSPLPPEATIALATCYNKTGRKNDTLTIGEAFLREHPGDKTMTELMIQAQPAETSPTR